jgi:hypothetical protein
MFLLTNLALFIFSFGFLPGTQKTESPHGAALKISCTICHSSKGWQIDKATYSFDHNNTKLPLTGQHNTVSCKACHPKLVFTGAKSNCIDCHTDIHQSSLGTDCSRCHTPATWLVTNIIQLHQTTRFPLVGAHRTADCIQCHKSENFTRIDVTGVNCLDCHRSNYLATTNPNHQQSGISEDCIHCHSVAAFQWTGAGFNHSSFPLQQGHATVKCSDCHSQGIYTTASAVCSTCHQKDFIAAKNPVHTAPVFSSNCQDCHSLSPGWKPAAFNHTKFPLTLGHSLPTCTDCHKDGNYAATPIVCYSCHQTNYTSTTNPNHISAGYSTTCNTCHTTNPGWKPATFNHTIFLLTLGHAGPACTACHVGGNYTTTSSVCYSCHTTDYNNTTNPKHSTLGFSTICTTCHTTVPGWKPATYTQHDAQFFPIYSGRHNKQWTVCTDCHTNTANYSIFTCLTCHPKTTMDNAHNGRSGYSYVSAVCYSCHPRGTAD